METTEVGVDWSPPLFYDTSTELSEQSCPKVVTNTTCPYTVEMNAITIFNQDAEKTEDDAPFNDVTASVEVDSDVWSLLLEMEAVSEAKTATSDSTNVDKSGPVTHTTPCNTMFDPLLDDCETVNDIDELFNLSQEIESSFAGSSCESTCYDMLANIISQTGLVNVLPSVEFQSDTTLGFEEILGQDLAQQDQAEQVVPDEVTQELVEVVRPSSQPVSRRKRKLPKEEPPSSPDSDPTTPPPTKQAASSNNKAEIAPEDKYTMMRIKNNEASKRSRQSRKDRFHQMDSELVQLEEDNVRLKAEAERLETAVNQLKSALASTILKLKK